MAATGVTREDNKSKLDRISIYLVKLVVLATVGIIAAWFSQDLFSTCISTLTFVATILIDSIINHSKCGSLNLPTFSKVLSLIALLSSVIAIASTIIGIICSHSGNTIEGYQIVATLIVIYLAVLESIVECIIAIRTKD